MSEVGREGRLLHPLKSSSVTSFRYSIPDGILSNEHHVSFTFVKCGRFCIDDGKHFSLEHQLKSSEVRLDSFPILSANDSSLEQPIKSREVSLEKFPILSGND